MTSKKKQQPPTDDFDYLALYGSAQQAVMNALLKEWGFDEHPSADLLVAAEKHSRNQTGIDDYVKEHSPPGVYEHFHAESEWLLCIGSVLGAPLERMCYWAEKLGIRKAPDDKMIFDPVGRYMIAKHGWNRYRFSHTDCGTIADILEKDAGAATDSADAIPEYRPRKSDDAYCVIQFLHQHRAFDKSSLCRTEDIAAGMTGRSKDQNSYKHAVAKLSKERIVDTATGRRGGVWLTDKGERLAADIFSTQMVR